MWDVFKGWRRKGGCISLMLAILVMTEWSLEQGQREREARRRTQCMSNLRWPPRPQPSYEEMLREQRRIANANSSDLPHLAIAIPLTLLSAYLLLWPNQRPKTVEKVSEYFSIRT